MSVCAFVYMPVPYVIERKMQAGWGKKQRTGVAMGLMKGCWLGSLKIKETSEPWLLQRHIHKPRSVVLVWKQNAWCGTNVNK